MRILCILLSLLIYINLFPQESSRKDSLRGNLTSLRTSYDVFFYDLFVMIDENEKSIERSYNIVHFIANSNLNKIQIDLASNMEILLVEFEGRELSFEREFDAVYIKFDREILQNEKIEIKVWYGGYPLEAINPPWDGGFTWAKDKNGNPFIGVSCQGLGASSWWPCKDHQSDEPDSMRITTVARMPWEIISNGNLRRDTSEWNNYLNSWTNIREWFVSYPINNYNVSLYIGDYIKFSDIYLSDNDTLELDYYVLRYNEEIAKRHFQQVKPMLGCFETYFGRYPFWNDGYALIESPYLGMEHQSAIAYGNNFSNGYYGNLDYIDGLEFDFIILHETGHEWWGNSITTNDIADMWIHEGFCTYSEVLYVECLYGYDAMLSYVNNQKRNVLNDKPIIGPYSVNKSGSTDMYAKGSLMLHTLRTLLQDDVLWFSILRNINLKFKYKIIDSEDIINYINTAANKDFTTFFAQYLHHKNLPQFQYKLQKTGRNYTLLYRWEAINSFDMPILINFGRDDIWIYPTNEWKEYNIGDFDPNFLNIRDDLLFIDVKKL